MPKPIESHSTSQKELDSIYSSNYIAIAERIYGYMWLSPGGETSTKELFLKVGFRPGFRVLDIGSGIGGAAIYLARQYGVQVDGVDYCKNMNELSKQRLKLQNEAIQKRVNFTFGDILEMTFETNSFDVIYSRDAVLHIKEKFLLFKKLKEWLKPGGKLLITDFCRGNSEPSEEFRNYVCRSTYNLLHVDDYAMLLKKAGFIILEASDISNDFAEINKKDLKYFVDSEEATVQEFGQELYNYVIARWKSKIRMTEAKEHSWGLFLASC